MPVRLAQLLFSQGFGTRRDCAALIASGEVAIAGQVVDDPDAEFDTDGLVFSVQGRAWPFHAQALVLLHKPAGYECSQKPRHHPGVLSLLPAPLRARGLQPVGRLDEDTTGLLLFTDDGTLIHRLTSPRHHVPKVYEVGTKHPVTPEQVAKLLAGVVLKDERADERQTAYSGSKRPRPPRPAARPVVAAEPGPPVRAAACEQTGERALRLTLTEGKYHQVKRMLAAAGNRVERLHRSSFGALALPADLPPGQWCWLDAAQRAAAGG
jgi:16S rRNA pseudouridine516 synthase